MLTRTVTALAALLALAAPAAALADPASSTLLQSGPTGLGVLPKGPVNTSSLARYGAASVSANGCRVVFRSDADGLTGGDPDHVASLYQRDLCTNSTSLLTVSAGGQVSSSSHHNATTSPNGRYVAFMSFGNLAPGADTSGSVYLRDQQSGAIRLVAKVGGEGQYDEPHVNDEGRVALRTSAPLDPARDAVAGSVDVYVADLSGETPAFELASRKADGSAAGGVASSIAFVDHTVAFATTTSLDGADANSTADVYTYNTDSDATQLVSRATGSGTPAVGGAEAPALSGNGAVVAYATTASMDAADTQGLDVYLRSGTTTTLVSRRDGAGGANLGGDSRHPSLDQTGTKVAFHSTSVVPGEGDTNASSDVFLRDVTAGTTRLLSRVGLDGPVGDYYSAQPTLSADGAYVVFETWGTNLAPATANDFQRVLRRRISDGTHDLVSAPGDTSQYADGVNAVDQPTRPDAVSGDGRYTTFVSRADALSDADRDRFANLFRRDNRTDETRLIWSNASNDSSVAGSARDAVISDDGNRIAFSTVAKLDGTRDTNGTDDVYVADVEAGTFELVSRFGGNAVGGHHPAISGDGEHVGFITNAAGTGDANATADVYVRHLNQAEAELATRRPGADGAAVGTNGTQFSFALDADGTHVAFDSQVTLFPDVENAAGLDVFVRDLAEDDTLFVSRADGAAGAGQNSSASDPSISADGTRVAFETYATNLGDGDATTSSSVYVRDTDAGTTRLASRGGNGNDTSSGTAEDPAISADGTRVAFRATAANWNFGGQQVWLRDLAAGTTKLVSRVHGASGSAVSGASRPSLSASGRCVAFASTGGLSPAHAGGDFAQLWLRAVDGECPDETAPDTQITEGPAAIVFEDEVEVTFGGDADAVAFDCFLDGAELATCASPRSLKGLTAGEHTFSVAARDAAGNADATPATATFVVDLTPPETTIDSGPSGTTSDTTPEFTFSSDDPAARFECAVDGDWNDCDPPAIELGALADGRHTFAVRAVDGGQRADTTPAERTFTVDTSGPTVEIGAITASDDGRATASITAEPGATLECAVDGGAFAACSSPHAMSGLSAGTHELRVRATDAAGNTGAPVVKGFTVPVKPQPQPQPPVGGGTPPPATNTAPSTNPTTPRAETPRTAATVKLAGTSVKLDRKGRATLTLRCTGAPCRGTAVLKAKVGRKSVVLARGTYTIAAGKTAKLTLKVGRKALKGKRTLKATLDLGGGTEVAVLTLRG